MLGWEGAGPGREVRAGWTGSVVWEKEREKEGKGEKEKKKKF